MAFVSLASTAIAVDKPITNELMTNIKDNEDYLYSKVGVNVGLLLNGGFEVDSDADGSPDNWTVSLYAGGAASRTTSTCAEGQGCMLFVRTSGAGNGGGVAVSDFVPVSTLLRYYVSFSLKQTSAQPRTKLQISWFDQNQSCVSQSTVYSSTVNPTAWTDYGYGVTAVPTSSKFCKIILVGGATDKNNAGSIWIDNVRFQEQIRQTMLKTSTASITKASTDGENLAMSGGEYSFYPQFKGNHIHDIKFVGEGTISSVTYQTLIHVSTETGTLYIKNRYVTSSGEVYWIFILREKDTKQIITLWCSHDHPAFGNGGKPDLLQHPFASYDESKHEIIVINPTQEEVYTLKREAYPIDFKIPNRSMAELIFNEYEIDESVEKEWPVVAVTVGVDKSASVYPGESVFPVKQVIKKPEYVKCYGLKKKIVEEVKE